MKQADPDGEEGAYESLGLPATWQSSVERRQETTADHFKFPEATCSTTCWLGKNSSAASLGGFVIVLRREAIHTSFINTQQQHEGLWKQTALQSLTNSSVLRFQVRIKVVAAAINFADALQLQGLYQEKPKLPFIPGSEVSGKVVEIGSDVRTLTVGDTVQLAILFSPENNNKILDGPRVRIAQTQADRTG